MTFIFLVKFEKYLLFSPFWLQLVASNFASSYSTILHHISIDQASFFVITCSMANLALPQLPSNGGEHCKDHKSNKHHVVYKQHNLMHSYPYTMNESAFLDHSNHYESGFHAPQSLLLNLNILIVCDKWSLNLIIIVVDFAAMFSAMFWSNVAVIICSYSG